MSKPSQQKAPKGAQNANLSGAVINDPRFANIHSDPRYQLPSKKHTHVKLDKRFSRMLRDEDFSKKASVDRYGRKLPKGTGRKELERFYRVDEDEGGDQDEEEPSDLESVEADAVDDDDIVRKELARVDKRYDPARDGGFSSSDESSSDEESEEDEVEDEEEETGFSFPDRQLDQQPAVPMGDITSRLAVVNLDWDNIRSADLMAVFSSFVPPSGKIRNISIYPSEFGKERMEKEEVEGPPREIFASHSKREEDEESDSERGSDDDDDDEEDERIKKSILTEDTGEEFDSAKLRQYQLERLRYYYAVITCTSPEVAKAIYDATDGTEYLTTANFFDLRFVPDDVSFEDDKPRDECDQIPNGYRPNEFVTAALQHSKVKLTWDEDDPQRKEAQKRAFTGSRAELDENDLKAYLASSSSEDEGEDGDEANEDSESEDEKPAADETATKKPSEKLSKKEAERQRMRALLGLPVDKPSSSSSSKSKTSSAPVGDMQVTFTPGLLSGENGGKSSVFENEPERDETTVEKYVRKEKERKARRKEKLKSGRNPEADASTTTDKNDIHDESSASESASEGEDEEEEDLGFNDPFFTSAPTKESKSAVKKRKQAERRAQDADAAKDAEAAARQRAELELLMLDDKGGAAAGASGDGGAAEPHVAHFDMKEIQKAEKDAAKRGKAKRKNKNKAGATTTTDSVQDDFQMNVSDPRFTSLFESHDFAIDPTNPRFSGTKAMKALLDEGRRKRSRREVDAEIDDRPAKDEGRKPSKVAKLSAPDAGEEAATPQDGVDLRKLVEKVKGKSKNATAANKKR
ncbi:hypothetical protein L228DRAFT_260133 [Xylona heveae TC161]|uniref:Uncharacterized protein n=1 Tax=Xylona heveae (strain CBS 132557 / TC161) TaxID=1328760 RepID=A0A165HC94_XYLHT|nr:hypothetical protein L228DRAFT_260133 [Xylona heveae TC161]KZF23286.1 hypothetical protein L228DRAFT_260133 [Xylona heveae TC161]